jgi:hypothetical protein
MLLPSMEVDLYLAMVAVFVHRQAYPAVAAPAEVVQYLWWRVWSVCLGVWWS